MGTHDLSVLAFSCSGREHLLARTWQAWDAPIKAGQITETMLALDGPFDASMADSLGFDVILHSKRRKGYVASIIRSLALVKSEFVFWLEDDWEPLAHVDIGGALDFLAGHPRCIQLRWSKCGPLEPSDKKVELDRNIYRSEVGFSANPCVCRTEYLRQGFAALQLAEKGTRPGIDGFENFLTRWCASNELECAVLDPGDKPAILHTGYLESTPRKWHMTESLTKVSAEPTRTAFREAPPLWRRLLMIVKLAVIFPQLAINQLRGDSYYDLAFRLIATFAKGKD